jgi:hypothetical protein
MKKEIVITIALEPTRWQRFLDKTGLKRFTYDEMMIAVEDGQHFYDRPNSKIRMIRVQENRLS